MAQVIHVTFPHYLFSLDNHIETTQQMLKNEQKAIKETIICCEFFNMNMFVLNLLLKRRVKHDGCNQSLIIARYES